MPRFAAAMLAAVAAGLAAALVSSSGVQAATPRLPALPDGIPDVYGGGVLFAFSGLDGRTSWAEPCVATTAGDELAFRLRLPREAVLRIRLPAPGLGAVRWRFVTNDLVAGTVPWDDVPLVVGFLSSGVVAGGLPLNCRVALDGGDAGTVLLRSAVGDRTRFAFAYDVRGTKEAAAAAAQAIHASLETLVESRAAFFQKVPAAPIDAERLRAKTLAKAFSVLKVNVYGPESGIGTRWTTPARWPLRDMFLRESAYHSLGLVHLDARLAQDALEAVFAFQREDGMIPHRMNPSQASDVSHPPILGWAAWQVHGRQHVPRREFLERAFDVVQKHVVWFMKNRRLDGEPPPEKPLEHGTPLYAWKSAEESGMETSPRFEGGTQFAAVDLSCYLASECRTLQAMAQALGYRELAKTWGQRAEAIAQAARRTLWDGQRGFFFDRKGPDGEWIDVWTVAGLLPLWAGLATPEQAARLRDHLVSKKFWTAAPVPSVARDDPKFKKDMWCGPTWITVNYMLVRGLQRYGFQKEAADLRERTLWTVAEWYARTGVLWEFYDCDGQAPPTDLERKGVSGGAGGAPVGAGAGAGDAAAGGAAGAGAAAGGPPVCAVVADYGPTAALFADLLLRAGP